MGARVLLVDDEAAFLKVMAAELGECGYDVATAASAEEALRLLAARPFDVVVADLHMDGIGGMGLLEAVREESGSAQVIVLTGQGSVETAVSAMRLGAYDYQLKPVEIVILGALIDKAVEKAALTRENQRLRDVVRRALPVIEIVGKSPAIRRARELALRAAASDATVLIRGETGTGKELFARLIHRESRRAQQPLTTVNCTTLPENLMESELFGHRRGSFTGADASREGLFELSDGGTIFLDEIGELPLPLQGKLLRALQFGEVKRVGESRIRTVDVRVLAATSRDLGAESEAGRFRNDLYYRLNVVELIIPPLRDRVEDIPLLVEAILRRWPWATGPRRFAPRSLDLLRRYSWPGNVRQMENLIERCLVLTDEVEIDLERSPFGSEIRAVMASGGTLPVSLEAMEREHIQKALERAQGNRAEAAKRLGISERGLYYKIKTLGLKE